VEQPGVLAGLITQRSVEVNFSEVAAEFKSTPRYSLPRFLIFGQE